MSWFRWLSCALFVLDLLIPSCSLVHHRLSSFNRFALQTSLSSFMVISPHISIIRFEKLYQIHFALCFGLSFHFVNFEFPFPKFVLASFSFRIVSLTLCSDSCRLCVLACFAVFGSLRFVCSDSVASFVASLSSVFPVSSPV